MQFPTARFSLLEWGGERWFSGLEPDEASAPREFQGLAPCSQRAQARPPICSHNGGGGQGREKEAQGLLRGRQPHLWPPGEFSMEKP